MKSACQEANSETVSLHLVIEHMQPLLEERFGQQVMDVENEAFVSSFIAGLFLTHRGMASITQEGDTLESVQIKDLWPQVTEFSHVLESAEMAMAEDANLLEGESTGSVHRLEAMAERAKKADAKEHRRLARLEQQTANDTEQSGEQTPKTSKPSGAIDEEGEATWPVALEQHEWLVE